jgi:di/tricarboxylate transporter
MAAQASLRWFTCFAKRSAMARLMLVMALRLASSSPPRRWLPQVSTPTTGLLLHFPCCNPSD